MSSRAYRFRFLVLAVMTAATASLRAEACDERDPALCDIQSCFPFPLPAYLVAIAKSGDSVFGAQQAVHRACADLKSPRFQGPESFSEKVDGFLWGVTTKPVFTEIPTLLSGILGDDGLKEYKKKLEGIGKIKNRYERLRRTYDLAHDAQGKDDRGPRPAHLRHSRLRPVP